MRRLLRLVRFVFSAGFRCDRRLAWYGFFMEPIGFGISTLLALWLKWVVDAIGDRDPAAMRTAVLGLVLTTVAGQLVSVVGWRHRTKLLEKTGAWLDEQIMRLAMDVPGLEHHERADYHDRREVLQNNGLGHSIIGLVPGMAALLRLIVTSVLLAGIHPLLVLLPVFGIPSVVMGAKAQRLGQKTWMALAPHNRRADHFYSLVIEPGPAKELRVFNLTPEIVRRHLAERRARDAGEARASLKGAGLRVVGWVVFALGYAGVIGFVAWLAARGEASLGDVMLTLTVAAQVNAVVEMMVDAVRRMLHSVHAAEQFLWLEQVSREAAHPGTQPPPERLTEGIRFEGVSFVYPGVEAETEVLAGVDLFLPAGARVAIVGDNGAGKTTLVKLLCGFYSPTSGRITVDGVDMADLDLLAWREKLAGGFQDYCRFELLAGETVGVGDLPRIGEEPALSAALDRAGGADVLGILPSGFATQLGRSFDGGVDLSLGQWQKLALGRAMMRERPLVLILDEPTASLDAKAEHALFERYAAAAAQRKADGAITVLVSHRFSTVRSADLIVVVDGGRIRELGSHAELLAAGGLYAELFSLQAAAYR